MRENSDPETGLGGVQGGQKTTSGYTDEAARTDLRSQASSTHLLSQKNDHKNPPGTHEMHRSASSGAAAGGSKGVWARIDEFQRGKTAVIAVVALALFTDMVLYDVIVPILPMLLQRVGKDDSYVGTLFAIYAVGFIIATPVFGIWSDRNRNRKLPMILGQAGLALATVLFAFARSFWVLILARFLQGIGAAVSWTLGLALLADAVPSSEHGAAMGIVFGFNTLGYFFGPLMGGILTQTVSLEAPFLICAGLCVLDLVARALIKPAPPAEAVDEAAKKLTILKLLCYPEVILISLLVVFCSSSFSAVETLLSAYLQENFGLDVMRVSFSMMAIIVPNVVFSLLGGWLADRCCRYTTILVSLSLYVFAMPFLGLSYSLWVFLLASAYFGATSAALQAPILPEMGSVVSRLGGGSYAKVYALVNICYSIGMLVGPLLASAINERANFAITMSLFSIPFIFIIPSFVWLALQNRRGRLKSRSLSLPSPHQSESKA